MKEKRKPERRLKKQKKKQDRKNSERLETAVLEQDRKNSEGLETAVLEQGQEALRQRLRRLEEENRAMKEWELELFGQLEETKARLELLEEFRRNRLTAAYLFIGLHRPGTEDGGEALLQLYLSRDGLDWEPLYQGGPEAFLTWAAQRLRRGEAFYLGELQAAPVFALQGTEKWLKFCLREADMREAEMREAEMREADMREAEMREAEMREAEMRKAEMRKAEMREADIREADTREADIREAAKRKGQLQAQAWTVWLADNRAQKEAGRFHRLRVPGRLPPPAQACKVVPLSLEEYRKLTGSF